MNQRKDTYRAALQREPDDTAPRQARVARLHTRYVRVTIELDPAVPRELTRWVGPPLSALLRAGAAALRPLTGTS
ncbi:hypothetical protein ACWD4F_23725 [Streptomyces aureus]|uniref:hypothetical protein n=1 Tax=Streptomyces aureus TaxID=193461 RepID=UPI000560A45B|nr:hypothetical protein [Streptomyces aureus]